MMTMRKRFLTCNGLLLAASLSCSLSAEEFATTIPMQHKGASTFYVTTEIAGLEAVDFMVDTGSGYATINEETLAILMQNQSASYIKDLEGILADGSRLVVPVYQVKEMNIGGACNLQDIQVAVFPGKTRQILGLSALRQASPFIFSMNPPQLKLSHCTGKVAEIKPETGPKAEALDKVVVQDEEPVSPS